MEKVLISIPCEVKESERDGLGADTAIVVDVDMHDAVGSGVGRYVANCEILHLCTITRRFMLS